MNENEITQIVVDAFYHIHRKLGPGSYDYEPHREALRRRGVDPQWAKRNTDHGSGLGVYRWVVERSSSWTHGFRKLRFVAEQTEERQFAFLNRAAALIGFRFLLTSLG